jgi:hypothetical protein
MTELAKHNAKQKIEKSQKIHVKNGVRQPPKSCVRYRPQTYEKVGQTMKQQNGTCQEKDNISYFKKHHITLGKNN